MKASIFVHRGIKTYKDRRETNLLHVGGNDNTAPYRYIMLPRLLVCIWVGGGSLKNTPCKMKLNTVGWLQALSMMSEGLFFQSCKEDFLKH